MLDVGVPEHDDEVSLMVIQGPSLRSCFYGNAEINNCEAHPLGGGSNVGDSEPVEYDKLKGVQIAMFDQLRKDLLE